MPIIKPLLFNLLPTNNSQYWPSIVLQKKNDTLLQTAKLKISFKNCLKAHFLSYLLHNVFNVLDLGNNIQQSGKTKQLPWLLPWHTYAWMETWCMNKNTSRSYSWSPSRFFFLLRLNYSVSSLNNKSNWDIKTCHVHKA